MSTGIGGWRSGLTLLAVMAAAPGCASLDGVTAGRGMPGGYGSVVDGQVRSVDARRGRLALRGRDGRTRAVHVHRDTPVRYRGDIYPVSALERGDEVRAFVTRDRWGGTWAERIEVRRSVGERYDRRYDRRRVQRLEGRVTRLDLRDGWMAVEPRRRAPDVLVYLPRDLRERDERRLYRLRRGDRVRMEVVPVGRNEATLVRFR